MALNIKAALKAYDKFNSTLARVQKDKVVIFAKNAVSAAMEQEKTKDKFIAQTGDVEVGTAMFDKFKSEALAAGQDVNKSLAGTLSFMPFTKHTEQLTQLNDLASRMAAFDLSGKGFGDVVETIKTALSGKGLKLEDLFGKAQVQGVIDASMSGDLDKFIAAFDTLLEAQGMSKEALETLLNSPAKQAEALGNNFRSAMAGAGVAAMEALTPVMEQLNAAFEAGKFQPFIDAIGSGIAWIVQQAVWLCNTMIQIYDFILSNWPAIEPILQGIIVAFQTWIALMLLYGAYMLYIALTTGTSTAALFLQTLVLHGLKAAWQTLNSTMRANIIILIVSLVIGLIFWLIKLWQTNDQFAAALMRAWNFIRNFFDQMPGFFWQLVEWLFAPFVWWAEQVGFIYDTVINGIIGGINRVLGIVNKVTGTSFEIEASFSMENIAKGIQDFAKGEKTEAFARAAQNAQRREQDVRNMLDDRAAAKAAKDAEKAAEQQKAAEAAQAQADALGQWDANVGRGTTGGIKVAEVKKVGEVDKINNEVDISNENLKLMRDLAEMKAIQNFVTLTPTVQVTTGPINHDGDVEKTARYIADTMYTELNASARGIFE